MDFQVSKYSLVSTQAFQFQPSCCSLIWAIVLPPIRLFQTQLGFRKQHNSIHHMTDITWKNMEATRKQSYTCPQFPSTKSKASIANYNKCTIHIKNTPGIRAQSSTALNACLDFEHRQSCFIRACILLDQDPSMLLMQTPNTKTEG